MRAARGAQVCAALLALLLEDCGASAGAERAFASPVPLVDVLAVPGVLNRANECELSIQDGQGRPVPNALLRLQWPEAGRVAFQTDASGSLIMRLSGELDSNGTLLSAESKPDGQDLLAKPYDESTQAIPGARIVVRVRAQD